MVDLFFYLIDLIGYLGPQILLIISIFVLYLKQNYLFYYIIGLLLNSIINFILKTIIQQPRPSEDLNIFNIAKTHGKRYGFDYYGMPSGHAQSAFFSTIFVYLVLKNTYLTSFYLLISLMTLFQRVKYKNHTTMQVIFGSFFGLLFGYLSYIIAGDQIRGKIKSKKDDNAGNV